MSVPRYIDPEETRFAHSRTDGGSFEKMVEMNDRLAFVHEPLEDTFGNVFIVGLQRSGTTIAYQLAASGTDAGYVNNLIARFWENPAYGVHLFRHLGLKKQISFESIYGTTETISDVHEFGYFWASLLGSTSNVSLADIDPTKVDWGLVRAKLLAMNHAFGSPCIHKNTLISHILTQLGSVCDRKLFVRVKRDYLEIASSILKVRQARYGDINRWWSVKPREYDRIKDLSAHEQVVAQIHYLQEDMEKQLQSIPADWLWEIDYDEICANPGNYVAELARRASAAGIQIRAANTLAAQSFPNRKLSHDDEDIRKLAHFLKIYNLPHKS